MKRLFTIWNRGYKHIRIVADDVSEALEIAAKLRHITHPTHYRKFEDITDKECEPGPANNVPSLMVLLTGEKSGKVKTTEHVWYFD